MAVGTIWILAFVRSWERSCFSLSMNVFIGTKIFCMASGTLGTICSLKQRFAGERRGRQEETEKVEVGQGRSSSNGRLLFLPDHDDG